MALIKITIEDLPNGNVKVVSDPNYETMLTIIKAEQTTSAHGYAMLALNEIRKASKRPGTNVIRVPRLRG